jgi:uncharacterized protein
MLISSNITPDMTRSKRGDTGFLNKLLHIGLVRVVLGIAALVPINFIHHFFWDMLRDMEGPIAPYVKDLERVSMIVVLILLYKAYVYLVDQRPAYEVSTSNLLPEFGVGFAFGAGLIALTVLPIALSGSYHIDGFGAYSILFHGIIMMAFYALLEDLLFRAVLYRIVEEKLGTWLSVILVASLFGTIHIFNDNATWVSSLALAVGDLSLAAVFVLTRRIWMVWGLHVGWNFSQDTLLGMANSGTEGSPSFIMSRVEGPTWLTGGDFGVELSVLGVFSSLFLGLYLMKIAAKRGLIIPPVWKRKAEVSNVSE